MPTSFSSRIPVRDHAAAATERSLDRLLQPTNRPPAVEFQDGAYQKSTLENGIRVVTERMPQVRSIALGILVDAGPQDEDPGQSGLAHLTEHLVFQGTSNRNSRQIALMMDLAGGQVGGFTTRDYTCYYANVLDEHCTYALDLMGDLLLNSTIPPDSLRRERDAILHEIEGGRDNPAERVHELLKSTAWADHRLGRPIAGRPETVQGLTRADVIYFFHQHYVPDRIIIAAAGHLDHADVVAQVRDAFWRMLGQGERAPRQPPCCRPGVALEHVPLSQAYFSLGIPAFPYAHADRYGLHVLSNLLGGGISSRLYRRLRDERGLVYGVGSEYHAYRDAGMLVIEGSTTPEHLIQVLGITLIELWQLATSMAPIDDEDLWKAKVQIRRQHLLAAESTSTRMSRLATQELYFGRHLPTDEVLAHIEALDAAALQRLASTYLTDALRQTTIAVVGPEAPAHYSLAILEELLTSFH